MGNQAQNGRKCRIGRVTILQCSKYRLLVHEGFKSGRQMAEVESNIRK